VLLLFAIAGFLGWVDRAYHARAPRRRWFRFSGALIFTGAIALAVTALANGQAGMAGRFWPVMLSGAAFTYLWWLSALFFDLTFIWHRYIRHSLAVRILAGEREKPAATAPRGGCRPPRRYPPAARAAGK
jgi:hypothetical protein